MYVEYPQWLLATLLFPDYATLSLLIVIAIFMSVMYLARWPAHKVILMMFRSIGLLLRQLIKYIFAVNARLRQRNRDILLTNGRELLEYKLEKNFVRIAHQVSHDLSVWPSLHRDMREQISEHRGSESIRLRS